MGRNTVYKIRRNLRNDVAYKLGLFRYMDVLIAKLVVIPL
jgi:hypothetical protein